MRVGLRGLTLLAAMAVVVAACGSKDDAHDASLTVSPGSVSFTTVQHATVPPSSASIRISFSDTAAAVVVAGYPPGTTAPAWLRLSLFGSGRYWTLSIAPQATGLPVGTHSATVRVGIARQDETVIATRDVQVSYTVRAGIDAYFPSEFTHVLGSTQMETPKTVQVTGTPGASWTATSSANWASLSASSGTVPARPMVSVNPTGLGTGSHTASITFDGAGGSSSIEVKLTIAAPTLGATPPGGVALGGASGHDLGAQEVQLVLSTGTNAHGWAATGAPAWLRLSPSTGLVSETAVPVALSLDPAGLAGLAAGTYTGAVTFTATVAGVPISTSVPVTLTLDAHELFASDGGVALASMPGLARLSRSLRIRSNRGVTTGWSARSNVSWLGVTASGTTGDPLVLTADPVGLAADTLHRAVVTITSSDPTVVNTEAIPVALWVGSATPEATTSVAGTFAEVLADPMRPHVYVHNRGTDLTVYDVYSGTLVATIAGVGKALGPMTASRDGARLFVADDGAGAIVPVDLETRTAGAPWPLERVNLVDNPIPFLAYARVRGVGTVIANDSHLYDAATGARYAVRGFYGTKLAASRDGSRLCSLDHRNSWHELACVGLDRNSSTGEVLLGAVKKPGRLELVSNGSDLALDEEGTGVYVTAESTYSFDLFDAAPAGETMVKVGSLAGAVYPTAVAVGADGRIYAGAGVAIGAPGPEDVWVYDASGTRLMAALVGSLVERGLAASGDGLRMVALTRDSLKLLTVAP